MNESEHLIHLWKIKDKFKTWVNTKNSQSDRFPNVNNLQKNTCGSLDVTRRVISVPDRRRSDVRRLAAAAAALFRRFLFSSAAFFGGKTLSVMMLVSLLMYSNGREICAAAPRLPRFANTSGRLRRCRGAVGADGGGIGRWKPGNGGWYLNGTAGMAVVVLTVVVGVV